MPGKEFFTESEDKLIIQTIADHGVAKGFDILSKLIHRSKRKIKERYDNTLNPELNHDFSESDDKLLISLYKIKGSRWTEIAKLMGNRSGNTLKSRHTSLMQKLKTGMILPDGTRTATFTERRHSKRTTKKINISNKSDAKPSVEAAAPPDNIFEENDENMFQFFFDEEPIQFQL